MKCCASPTISTAAETRADAAASTAAPSAQTVVEALLFREVLKPLAQALGPVGDVMLGTIADDCFIRRPR